MATSKKPATPAASQAAKTAAAAPAPAQAPKKEAKVPLAKMRGPRGVPETAKIHKISTDNPKRAGSKAAAAFACYKEGMTVGAFCDAVNAAGQDGMGTPNLVYDTKHGFISIEGYDPGEIIKAKEKVAKAPKTEKAEAKGKPVTKAPVKSEASKKAKEEVMD